MDILVINGPNINMVGSREPKKYGEKQYVDINNELKIYALSYNIDLDFFQSNFEGELISIIQKAIKYDGIIINAGGLTHTSVSIRDALLSINSKFIEVHLSNIFSREEFRQKSYLSDIAIGMITGFKEYSYFLAVDYFAYIKGRKKINA